MCFSASPADQTCIHQPSLMLFDHFLPKQIPTAETSSGKGKSNQGSLTKFRTPLQNQYRKTKTTSTLKQKKTPPPRTSAKHQQTPQKTYPIHPPRRVRLPRAGLTICQDRRIGPRHGALHLDSLVEVVFFRLGGGGVKRVGGSF